MICLSSLILDKNDEGEDSRAKKPQEPDTHCPSPFRGPRRILSDNSPIVFETIGCHFGCEDCGGASKGSVIMGWELASLLFRRGTTVRMHGRDITRQLCR